MTLPELLLAIVLLAAVLGSLQIVSASLRAETADEQTRRTLRALRAAAALHFRLQHTGEIDPTSGGAQALQLGPTAAALGALNAHPRTASLLTAVKIDYAADGSLIVRDGYGRPIRYLPPTPGIPGSGPGISPGSEPTPDLKSASGVEGPGSPPSATTSGGDFVSAGPDGRFGTTSGGTSGGGSTSGGPGIASGATPDLRSTSGGEGPGSAAADNLYGSDLETSP